MPPFAAQEQSFGVADGAREGAFLVAEQFAFDEIFRQSAAIDGNEGRVML